MANQAKSRIAALVFGVVMLAAVPACAQWGGGYGGTPTPAPQDRDNSGYGGRAPRGDSGYQRGPWRRDRDYDDERPDIAPGTMMTTTAVPAIATETMMSGLAIATGTGERYRRDDTRARSSSRRERDGTCPLRPAQA